MYLPILTQILERICRTLGIEKQRDYREQIAKVKGGTGLFKGWLIPTSGILAFSCSNSNEKKSSNQLRCFDEMFRAGKEVQRQEKKCIH